MEQLQRAYLGAVAAAAGCTVLSSNIDDGVDAQLQYEYVDGLATPRFAQLMLQLKSTTARPASGVIKAKMTRRRFDFYSAPATSITFPRMVVIMGVPANPSHWVFARDKGLTIHRAAYWTNLAGQTSSATTDVTISAQTVNIFDDLALCRIMQRIADGGAL